MKRLAIPILMLVVGLCGGVGAGLYLQPDAAPDTAEGDADQTGDHAEDPPPPEAETDAGAGHDAATTATGREYARLNNQFVVPVVSEGRVGALVALSLSIEVDPGSQEAVFAAEPKLRDVFLQVLFDHANLGGFEGNFTTAANMRSLREALRDAAQSAVGPQISDVLIIDIVRQDV